MKTPRLKELKRLDKQLKGTAPSSYRRVLGVVLTQYARVTGDLKPLGHLRAKDYARLYSCADSMSSTVYEDAAKHFAASQVAALIRKYPWDPAEVQLDPEARARESFAASEHRCKWMNRWSRASFRRNADNSDALLRKMKAYIRYVLGTKPDLQSIYQQCDFTAGASIGVHGNATNLFRKLSAEKWSVTPTALPYFAAALCHNFHYATRVAKRNEYVQSLYVSENDVRESCELVDYDKIAFVYKTAKTFRSISVPPLGNGYLQKGVDLEMKKFLKRVGIDLSDQSLNQEWARKGSLDDSEEGFCTIDLSSASDSISVGLVKLLLPPAWFRFLDSIRSPSYVDRPGAPRKRYEKFCAMGNGFCFPLESLIFAAACHAVTGGNAREEFVVYGDDIIVRRKAFVDVVSLLKRIGFKTNARKTFSTGPFRESCGSNWYYGEDVTPFTLDFALDSLQALFKAINLSRRNARSSAFMSEVVTHLLGRIPDQFMFLRPFKGPPDSGIDFLDIQVSPRWYWNKFYQCPEWFELKSRPRKDEISDPHPWIVNAAALRGHPSNRLFVIRRSAEMRVRKVARSGEPTARSKMVEKMVYHPDVGPAA